MAEGYINQTWNNSDTGYCKMPDGTLMQWGWLQRTVASSGSQWSGTDFYYVAYGDIDFPISFVGSVYVSLTPGRQNSFFVINSGSEASKIKDIYIAKPSAFSTSVEYAMFWTAFGRWK